MIVKIPSLSAKTVTKRIKSSPMEVEAVLPVLPFLTAVVHAHIHPNLLVIVVLLDLPYLLLPHAVKFLLLSILMDKEAVLVHVVMLWKVVLPAR